MQTANKHIVVTYVVSSVLLVLLFGANIIWGSVAIPFSSVVDILMGGNSQIDSYQIIVRMSRLPQATTALLAGAALAVSGLMLQTLFSNPLAAPSILGISSGAGLGVAVVMLFIGGGQVMGFFGNLAIVSGALVGAMAVLGLILLFSSIVKSSVMLLVVGIMVGYIATSAVSLLSFFATTDSVASYVVWGFGDYSSVNSQTLPFFATTILLGLAGSLLLIKPLNALLLGERYSRNLGLNVSMARILVLLITGLLTAVVTAFCGPIAFIGLAVPHIARLVTGTSNHTFLLPITIIMGSAISLLCNLLTVTLGGDTLLPLNVITPLLGAPVIIYVVLNKKKIAYFN